MSLTSPILASSVPITLVPLNFDASIWSCVCLGTNFGESAALLVEAPGAAAAGGSAGVVVGVWASALVSARPLTAAAAMSLLIMSGLHLGTVRTSLAGTTRRRGRRSSLFGGFPQ